MNETPFRSPFPPIEIRLDRDLLITHVGGGWDAFAFANGGKSLVGKAVIGRPITSFIHGDAVRMFTDVVFERMLRLGGTRTIRYRCDSPGIIREMEMTLTAIPDGLHCKHRIVRETPSTPRAKFPTVPRAVRLRCSHCNELFSLTGSPMTKQEAADGAPRDADGTVVIEVDYFICRICRGTIDAA